jgi:hypothetical protein
MLDYLHNPKEAAYLLTEVAEKIIVDEGDVVASTTKYFTNPSEHLKTGAYRELAAISTENHLKGVIAYVAASGLIFAHSFLEESLDTTLKLHV